MQNAETGAGRSHAQRPPLTITPLTEQEIIVALARLSGALPAPKRQKLFDHIPYRPIDRNDAAKLVFFARVHSRRLRQPGQHGGALTRTHLAVLETILRFRHSHSGECRPTYKQIADETRCVCSTVREALRRLVALGLLRIITRLMRVNLPIVDPLSGRTVTGTFVIRLSNAYLFDLWWRDRVHGWTSHSLQGEIQPGFRFKKFEQTVAVGAVDNGDKSAPMSLPRSLLSLLDRLNRAKNPKTAPTPTAPDFSHLPEPDRLRMESFTNMLQDDWAKDKKRH